MSNPTVVSSHEVTVRFHQMSNGDAKYTLSTSVDLALLMQAEPRELIEDNSLAEIGLSIFSIIASGWMVKHSLTMAEQLLEVGRKEVRSSNLLEFDPESGAVN